MFMQVDPSQRIVLAHIARYEVQKNVIYVNMVDGFEFAMDKASKDQALAFAAYFDGDTDLKAIVDAWE